MNLEHITQSFETSFTQKPAKLDVQKNIRLSSKADVWDILAEYETPGLKKMSIQLKRAELFVYGLSCTVELGNKKTIRFDFVFDANGPVIDMWVSKVIASVLYMREEDNNRFSINIEIDKYSIPELVSKKRGVLMTSLKQARMCDVMKPGVLNTEEASQEQRGELLRMSADGLEIIKDALDQVGVFAEKVRVDVQS